MTPQEIQDYCAALTTNAQVRIAARKRRRLDRKLAYNRMWCATHPDAVKKQSRAKHLRLKYNLTTEAWDEMLKRQGYKCASCPATEPGGKHNVWHVDHVKGTKIVRGLLCDKCNRGMGYFDHEPDKLRFAAVYLEKHNGQASGV